MYKNKKIVYSVSAIIFILIISFVILMISKNKYVPSVASTTPANQSEDVQENSQIEISFDEKLDNKNNKYISVVISPLAEYDSTWNLNTFKIIPKNLLDNAKKYTVYVFFKEKQIYSFEFTTSFFSQVDIEKNRIRLAEDASLYNKALKEIVSKYPFYPNLPIKTTNYVVYYDFDKDKFAITFLTEINNEIDQQNLIKNAIERIKNIGATEPINYYINNYIH